MPTDTNDGSIASLLGAKHLRARNTTSELVQDCLKTVDVITFIEIGILYYLDNSTLLLIIRALTQTLYITSRSPFISPGQSLLSVLFANAICIISNLLFRSAQPVDKLTRGYQHGGLLVDFVGELGPVSRLRMICGDILVLLLQLFSLALREDNDSTGSAEGHVSAPVQDLESEERGLRRSQEISNEEQAIELRDLSQTREDRSEHETRTKSKDEVYTGDDLLFVLHLPSTLRDMAGKNTSAAAAAVTSQMQPGVIPAMIERIAAARARMRS